MKTYISLLTVSELDNLNKMGFTYDFNIHEHEIMIHMYIK
jgi:hypothetical protein